MGEQKLTPAGRSATSPRGLERKTSLNRVSLPTRRWRKTDSNPRSRLSRAARSAADQLGKPGEDKTPDEPRQTHKYEQIGSLGRGHAEQHDEQRRCPENDPIARRLHAEIAEPRHE